MVACHKYDDQKVANRSNLHSDDSMGEFGIKHIRKSKFNAELIDPNDQKYLLLAEQ